MSRGKRQFDEEDFDEYALWDDRIRGDGRARLEDVPPSNQDYGVGPGYLGRARQSPRSPSIIGDDEIRPSRRRAASPDDSDRGGERRGFRKVGDAYDPDDVFDEPFVFVEPRNIPPVVSNSAVKRAMSSRVWADGFGGIAAPSNVSINYLCLPVMGSPDIWSRFPDSHRIQFDSMQLRLLLSVPRTSRVLYAEGTEPRLNSYIRDRYLHFALVYDRQPERWESKSQTSLSWKDVFKSDYTPYSDPNIIAYSNLQAFEFTNQDNSHRFRVMYRKCVNVPVKRCFIPKERVLTGSLVGDIGPYPTILNLSGLVQDPLTIGWEIEEFDSVFLDEFVNLCGLPGWKSKDPEKFEKGAFFIACASTYHDSNFETEYNDYPTVHYYYRLSGRAI